MFSYMYLCTLDVLNKNIVHSPKDVEPITEHALAKPDQDVNRDLRTPYQSIIISRKECSNSGEVHWARGKKKKSSVVPLHNKIRIIPIFFYKRERILYLLYLFSKNII